jgi:hypothetical protein
MGWDGGPRLVPGIQAERSCTWPGFLSGVMLAAYLLLVVSFYPRAAGCISVRQGARCGRDRGSRCEGGEKKKKKGEPPPEPAVEQTMAGEAMEVHTDGYQPPLRFARNTSARKRLTSTRPKKPNRMVVGIVRPPSGWR